MSRRPKRYGSLLDRADLEDGAECLFSVTNSLGRLPDAAEDALEYAAYSSLRRKYAEELAGWGFEEGEDEVQLELMKPRHFEAAAAGLLALSDFPGRTVKERIDRAFFQALRGSLQDGFARPSEIRAGWDEEKAARDYVKWFGKAKGLQDMRVEAAANGEAEFAKLLEKYSEDRK